MKRIGISIVTAAAIAALTLAGPATALAAGHRRPLAAGHHEAHAAGRRGTHSAGRHRAHGARRHHRKAHGAKHAAHRGKRSNNGERKLSASITIKLTPPSPELPQTNQINLFVPKGFHDAGAKLPQCKVPLLEDKGPYGCPKASIVGAGNSIGYTILGGEYVVEHLKLTMINGPHGSLLTWVEGRSPVEIEEIVTGVITAPSGFGQEMSFAIPHGLLEPLPGAPGWLQTLNAHLSGKAGWLRTTSCPAHPWKLKAELGYTNGEGISVETELACVG